MYPLKKGTHARQAHVGWKGDLTTWKTHTDEYAVMLDGLNPIRVLPAGEQVEWSEYWPSWMEKR